MTSVYGQKLYAYTQSSSDAMLTNVYDMTSFIDHDVAIVSVLDLQQVADEGVGSHAPDKTAASLQ